MACTVCVYTPVLHFIEMKFHLPILCVCSNFSETFVLLLHLKCQPSSRSCESNKEPYSVHLTKKKCELKMDSLQRRHELQFVVRMLKTRRINGSNLKKQSTIYFGPEHIPSSIFTLLGSYKSTFC